MARLLVILIVSATALTGCGVADPYATSPHRPLARAPRVHAQEVKPLPLPPPRPGAPSAVAAARSFAIACANWSWRTIRTSERLRATLAAPPFRAQLLRDAIAVRDDTELTRDQVVSRGTVLGVAPTGHQMLLVIARVTQASHGIDAIGDSRIVVYRAAVFSIHGRWYIRVWTELAS